MTNAPSQAPSPYFQEIIDRVEKALAEAAIVARKKAQETGTPLINYPVQPSQLLMYAVNLGRKDFECCKKETP